MSVMFSAIYRSSTFRVDAPVKVVLVVVLIGSICSPLTQQSELNIIVDLKYSHRKRNNLSLTCR